MDIALIATKEYKNMQTAFQEVNQAYLEQLIKNPINSRYISLLHESIDLCIMQSYLEFKGILVKSYHMWIDFNPIENMIQNILRENPKMVGIEVHFDTNMLYAIQIAAMLRHGGYNQHIFMFGNFPKLIYDNILKSLCFIDSVVSGSGQATYELYEKIVCGENYSEIAGVISRGNEEIKINAENCERRGLDNKPFPKRDVLEYLKNNGVTGVSASMYLSRGCNNSCIYCMGAERAKRCKEYWIPRSTQDFIKELKELISRYNIKYIYFLDDNFCGYGKEGKKHIQEFIYYMKKEKIHIKFHAELRIDSKVSDEDLKALKDIGLDVALIGIESGVQACLDRWKKGIKVKQTEKFIDRLTSLNINFSPAYIMVDPYTSLEEFKESVAFMKKYGFFHLPNPWFLFNKMRVYPGTEFERKLIRDNIISRREVREYNYIELIERPELIYECYRNLSFNGYEILNKDVKVLWNGLYGAVSEVIEMINVSIPQKIEEIQQNVIGSDKIEMLKCIRNWRKNIGMLLEELVDYSISWTEDDNLQKRISLTEYLNNCMQTYNEKMLKRDIHEFFTNKRSSNK